MATPVTVTLAELSISARLGRIKDVLERADATKPNVGVLGVGGMLLCAVEAHQQMATESANAYENTDTELAKELTKQSSPGGGGRKAS